MNSIYLLILIFILIELFEASWQKSNSLYGLIANNFAIYKKSMLFYFVLHTSFIYAIFLSIYLANYGFWMSSIIVIKFIDISFKLFLLQKLDNGVELNRLLPVNIQMNIYFKYLGVVIYPLSFYFAL